MNYQEEYSRIRQKLQQLDSELQVFGAFTYQHKTKQESKLLGKMLVVWMMVAGLIVGCTDQPTKEQPAAAPSSADSMPEYFDESIAIDTGDWDTIVPKNYLDFAYSRVIAFATVDPYDMKGITGDGMEFSGFQDTISRTLKKKQITFLNDLLSGRARKPYRRGQLEESADCFNPRHNIAFLNKQDSIVNWISVCFECGNVERSKYDLASMENFKEFFNKIGLKAFDIPEDHAAYYDSLNRLKKHRH